MREQRSRDLKEENTVDNQEEFVGRRAEFWIQSAQQETWVVMWTETTKFFVVEASTRESAAEIVPSLEIDFRSS